MPVAVPRAAASNRAPNDGAYGRHCGRQLKQASPNIEPGGACKSAETGHHESLKGAAAHPAKLPPRSEWSKAGCTMSFPRVKLDGGMVKSCGSRIGSSGDPRVLTMLRLDLILGHGRRRSACRGVAPCTDAIDELDARAYEQNQFVSVELAPRLLRRAATRTPSRGGSALAGRFVTRVRRRTVANVDSIGLVVRSRSSSRRTLKCAPSAHTYT
ncbi:MAG: hypothetical protein JWN48_3423 [Myxococcaceae bacterium]|nr:hypothetical protein [Myxococcaceae bacterium]